MNDEHARRTLSLFESPAARLTLREIASRLDLEPRVAERVVRALLRARRLSRHHAGHGVLAYGLRLPNVANEAAGSNAAARAAPKARTLTSRILDVLRRHQVPLRCAEVVMLAGLADDARQVSRVSATLCMLARRGHVRRDGIEGYGVCYALPDAPDRSGSPLLPRELIMAGFRPAIPRDGRGEVQLDEWLAEDRHAQALSAAAICQRIRRGWPPELASSLPLLRRSA